MKKFSFLLIIKTILIVSALENNLARTPPMGWLAWERFRCNTDCQNDPKNCISDQLFRTMADLVQAEGYAELGYKYIIIDDCWLEKDRDGNGQLVADKERFPYGIKSLSDYIHSKGLKFGIYQNYGEKTCAGYPGLLGHLEDDANLFASWNVDYVKIDGCNIDMKEYDKGYPEFGKYLQKTGRPMVYSCSWPYYQKTRGMKPNYTAVIEHCNLWRYDHDIEDSWKSVDNIIEYYGNNQEEIIKNAGPGHWNDPDSLIIGNFGLSYEQSKTQMAMWAIMAAPLLMSVDLRTIKQEYKAILQNKKIIEVNQDPLGAPGRRTYNNHDIQCWVRPITPVFEKNCSYAFVFRSRRTDGAPYTFYFTLMELGLTYSDGYKVEDLFENINYGVLTEKSQIKVKINPSGVVMLRFNLNLIDNNI